METKLMKLFLHVAFFSLILVALSIPGLILLDPSAPPFILSIRKDSSSISWTSSFGVQHIVILFETWMSSHIMMGGSLEIAYMLFAGIVTMLNYFDVLRR